MCRLFWMDLVETGQDRWDPACCWIKKERKKKLLTKSFSLLLYLDRRWSEFSIQCTRLSVFSYFPSQFNAASINCFVSLSKLQSSTQQPLCSWYQLMRPSVKFWRNAIMIIIECYTKRPTISSRSASEKEDNFSFF